jgi:hypothetical protein
MFSLLPTGNPQGGYYFISLIANRKLSRQEWDKLLIPNGVVAAVKGIGQANNQPLIGHGTPLFKCSHGVPIEDNVQALILQGNHGDLQILEEEDKGEEDKAGDKTLFGREEPATQSTTKSISWQKQTNRALTTILPKMR